MTAAWWTAGSWLEWSLGWVVLGFGYIAAEVLKKRRHANPRPYTGRRFDGPQTGTVRDDPTGQPKEHQP